MTELEPSVLRASLRLDDSHWLCEPRDLPAGVIEGERPRPCEAAWHLCSGDPPTFSRSLLPCLCERDRMQSLRAALRQLGHFEVARLEDGRVVEEVAVLLAMGRLCLLALPLSAGRHRSITAVPQQPAAVQRNTGWDRIETRRPEPEALPQVPAAVAQVNDASDLTPSSALQEEAQARALELAAQHGIARCRLCGRGAARAGDRP